MSTCRRLWPLLLGLSGCDAVSKDTIFCQFFQTPDAQIITPFDSEDFRAGATIELVGVVSDDDSDLSELRAEWTYNDDLVCVDLVPDDTGTVRCSTVATTSGSIDLWVTDERGSWGHSSSGISVDSNEDPNIRFLFLGDGRELQGTPLHLEAEISDDYDHPEDLSVVLEVDGVDVTPADAATTAGGTWTGTVDGLEPGMRLVELHVTDSDGGHAVHFATVEVFAENTAPACVVNTPEPNAIVEGGEPLEIAGEATDAETPSDDLRVRIESSLDGTIEVEAYVSGSGDFSDQIARPSEGEHLLTITVTDEWDSVTTCAQTITVVAPE